MAALPSSITHGREALSVPENNILHHSTPGGRSAPILSLGISASGMLSWEGRMRRRRWPDRGSSAPGRVSRAATPWEDSVLLYSRGCVRPSEAALRHGRGTLQMPVGREPTIRWTWAAAGTAHPPTPRMRGAASGQRESVGLLSVKYGAGGGGLGGHRRGKEVWDLGAGWM